MDVQVLGEVQRALDPLGVGRGAPLGFWELYSEQVAASCTEWLHVVLWFWMVVYACSC